MLLTARSEGFLVGRPDLDETLRRLSAYAEAGAECLYAPGIKSRDQIAAVVGALAPRAVNVLVGGCHTTVAELAGLGVRRKACAARFGSEWLRYCSQPARHRACIAASQGGRAD